jgi:hypothetical protein
VEIHKSARRHGVVDEDIRHVVEHAVVDLELDAEPRRVLYLGFDRKARPLEVIVLWGSKGEIAIHAMPIRRKYLPLMP